MNSPSYPPTILWGPGYIGLVISIFLYAVGVCQFAFYCRTFPCDKIITKLHVHTVTALGTAHFFGAITGFYQALVSCHRNTAPQCSYYVPSLIRVAIVTIALVYCVTSMVQVFYAHRVWIISGRNIIITLAVLVTTVLQLAFGMMVLSAVVQTPTFAALFTPYTPLSAIASVVCDAIITISVMYYLRPKGIRRESFINKLLLVFVQMNVFTLITALAMVILYYIEDHPIGQLLTAAPGVILSASYVNSMLGVLNARKPIRDQRNAQLWTESIELPTLSVIST